MWGFGARGTLLALFIVGAIVAVTMFLIWFRKVYNDRKGK